MHDGDAMPLVRRDKAMAEAILEMTAKRFGCVGVTDDAGKLVGIVTDGDLRRHMGDDDLLRAPVDDVMTRSPEDDPAAGARRRGAGSDERSGDHQPLRRRREAPAARHPAYP